MTQQTVQLSAAATSQATAISAAAALIGLDWGTSSLRSYVFDAAGQVLAAESWPWGIMRLPALNSDQVSAANQADDPAQALRQEPFELAFEAACGAWLAARPELAVIACGMVGSAQGWVEAPYVEGHADAQILARAMTRLTTRRGHTLSIVPGVLERGTLPNVMRGEETQIVGVSLARQAASDADAAPVLIGLPGTHAKWALSQNGGIGHFDTFMTGEVFALLRDHSILGRTMIASEPADQAAFLRGIAVARSESESSLLATIFSVRTMGLTGQLSGSQQADYLSGLLIGNELASLETSLSRHDGLSLAARRVVLSGEERLCERYLTALNEFGCTTVSVARDATERGLWHIAVQAGLVAAADGKANAAALAGRLDPNLAPNLTPNPAPHQELTR
jgi:2-dehydro-3-deoxygalactonokinase